MERVGKINATPAFFENLAAQPDHGPTINLNFLRFRPRGDSSTYDKYGAAAGAGFSIALAGGGIRGGVVHGKSDKMAADPIEGKVEPKDITATILHCLGLDHEKLTFRFSGRDVRLTDVSGEVITEILS